MTYEIHLHPTYRVPCLWFTLHGLSESEPAFNIDTVFRRLVPDGYKDALRGGIGSGSISADVSLQPNFPHLYAERQKKECQQNQRLTMSFPSIIL